MKLLLLTPSTVVRIIKLSKREGMKSTKLGHIATAYEDTAPKSKVTNQESALGDVDESLKSPPDPQLSRSFSFLYLSLCRWNVEDGRIATLLLAHSPLPWLFWCGRETVADSWKKPCGNYYL